MLAYLLDTHIVIYVIKRKPVEVLATFNANAARMAISVVTLAELLHGAEKSSRPAANRAVVEDFSSRLESCPTPPKPRSTTGKSAPNSNVRANPSESTTCTSPPTRVAKGWCW